MEYLTLPEHWKFPLYSLPKQNRPLILALPVPEHAGPVSLHTLSPCLENLTIRTCVQDRKW